MKKIAIGLAAAVVIFVIVVATRPAATHVERSATIAATPEQIFPELNSLKAFTIWSPWDKMDPKMKKEFSGPEAGPGASYTWSGNEQVGQGRLTIIESKPHESITERLEFITPYETTSTITFAVKSAGAGSTVTWSMDTKNDFFGKAAGMFMDMDKTIGKDFEAGLKQLKEIAEQKAKASASQPAPAPAP